MDAGINNLWPATGLVHSWLLGGGGVEFDIYPSSTFKIGSWKLEFDFFPSNTDMITRYSSPVSSFA